MLIGFIILGCFLIPNIFFLILARPGKFDYAKYIDCVKGKENES